MDLNARLGSPRCLLCSSLFACLVQCTHVRVSEEVRARVGESERARVFECKSSSHTVCARMRVCTALFQLASCG
eukprot:3361102-Rhodomonas_salina.2